MWQESSISNKKSVSEPWYNTSYMGLTYILVLLNIQYSPPPQQLPWTNSCLIPVTQVLYFSYHYIIHLYHVQMDCDLLLKWKFLFWKWNINSVNRNPNIYIFIIWQIIYSIERIWFVLWLEVPPDVILISPTSDTSPYQHHRGPSNTKSKLHSTSTPHQKKF